VIKSRTRLTRGQVSAVQHLVAAAVAGLNPSAVAIVDDTGQLLAGGAAAGSEADMAAGQEERTSGFEDRLRQRVENIVSSIVGPGRVRVQVSADMDFNRVTESSEVFDPDSRVIRSQQTVEQNSSDRDPASTQAVSVANALPGAAVPAPPGEEAATSTSTRTEETVNYEISKTTKTQVLEAGTVKKLSVAVVVDGSYTAGVDGARNYAARSPEEMTQITELVRSAIGFNEARGDQVQVTNMRFAEIDLGPDEPIAEPLMGLGSEIWFKLGQILILSVTALLIGLLIVKPMIRRLLTPPTGGMLVPATAGGGAVAAVVASDGSAPAQAQIAAGPTPQVAAAPAPLVIPRRESMIDVTQIEGQVRESAVRKVGEVVGAHPEEAMAILRTWLHQPV
jgi:flagellar M-ring protein FliF